MRAAGIVVPLGNPKQRAVLALLLMNRNRPVAVYSLLTAAWEETPPSGERANIHSYMSNLRRLLNSLGVDGKAVLTKVAPSYAINVDDTDVDLGRLSPRRPRQSTPRPTACFEHASQHLSAALAEWRGPVLEDLRDYAFVDAFATAMTEEKGLAHIARAESEIACGRSEAVIGELEELAGEHPFREPLWGQLIAAYYLADRQSDALDAFQRLKVTLADELGIDPSPALRELHEKVLRQEPVDVKKAATTTAAATVMNIDQHAEVAVSAAVARLRDGSGQLYPLTGRPRGSAGRRTTTSCSLASRSAATMRAVGVAAG